MSESADTATAADSTEAPAETAETDLDATATTDEPEPVSTNAEAAKWRTKLRETEVQRDALTERLTGYQRRQCEAAVADLLELPADLWDLGKVDPAAFFGDDDELNTTELRAAAGALLDMRPRLAKERPKGRLEWGQYSGSTGLGGGKASWSDVISSH